MRLTRRYRLSASHRLFSPLLSEAENARLYGKCANPYGHGHNYAVEISVLGEVNPTTGQVVDLRVLDELAFEEVIAVYDHRDLNSIADFEHTVPTSENLGVVIRRRLAERWQEEFPDGPALDSVRIEETERNIFEIR